MVPRNNAWFKIGRLVTLAAAGATAFAHSERSIETRKDPQNKERGLRERAQNSTRPIDSPWLRCPRRSSFLQPLDGEQSSITRSSIVLECFRARKEPGEIPSADEPSAFIHENTNYVDASWEQSSVETTANVEATTAPDGILVRETQQGERYKTRNMHTLDETRVDDGEYVEQDVSSTTHPLTGLARNLHQTSINLFTEFAPLISRSAIFHNHKTSILEDVGRLYLWGESFDQEQWLIVLQSSTRLRTLILDLTNTLCETLTEEMFPLIEASCSDLGLLHQIDSLRDLLRQLDAQRLCSSEDEEDDFDNYSDGESELGEPTFNPESVATVIRSSVDCLMELLPSMERILEAALEQ